METAQTQDAPRDLLAEPGQSQVHVGDDQLRRELMVAASEIGRNFAEKSIIAIPAPWDSRTLDEITQLISCELADPFLENRCASGLEYLGEMEKFAFEAFDKRLFEILLHPFPTSEN